MKTGSHVHFTFLVMLLLAIFVRSFIPVGFMADASSKTTLTICSGLTTKTIFVQDHAPLSGHEDMKHEPCPFAPPVLADNSYTFDITNYISIAYAQFHPDQNAHINIVRIAAKSFLSQGPPENIAV